MASSDLKLSIKINLKEVQEAINTLQNKFKDLINVAENPLEFTSNSDQLQSDIESVQSEINNIDGTDVEIVADNADAIQKAEETQETINMIPEKKETKFKFTVTNMAKIGLAANAVIGAYNAINSKVKEFISLSNTQELAEQRLTSALKIKGLATQENIDYLKKYASEIQKATVVGDEQVLSLLATANNLGISYSNLENAVEGSIGLATAFKDVGMTQEQALKGIALAYEGNFTQLQRYIPELRNASTEAEKMNILQRHMAQGFTQAKDEAQTSAGQLKQLSNLIGDLKEQIGDVIKVAFTPMIKALTILAELLNNYPQVFKPVIAIIGSITIALTAWRIAQLLLNKSMLANPIGIAVIAIAGLVGALSVCIEKIGGFAQAWEYVKASLEITWEYMKAFGDFLVNFSLSAVQVLTYPYTIMARTAKNIFSDIGGLLKKLLSGDFKGFADGIANAFKDGFTQTNDSIKTSFNNSIDVFSGLGEKAKQIWSGAKIESEKTAENIKEIANTDLNNLNEVEVDLEKLRARAELEAQYSQDKISQIKTINALLLEDELKKAKDVGASEETVANIREFFRQKEAEEIQKFHQEQAENEQKRLLEIQRLEQLKADAYKQYYEKIKFEDKGYYTWKENEIETQYQLELQKLIDTGMSKIEAERLIEYQILNEKKALRNDYERFLIQKFQNENRLLNASIDALQRGYENFTYSLIRTDMTAQQRRQAMWNTMKNSFIRSVVQMTSAYLKQKMIELFAFQSVEKTKEKTLETSTAKQIAITLGTTLKKVGMAIWEMAAKIYAFFASLGPFGFPLAAASIGTGTALIMALRKGFASGGYTGSGGKYEPAGIVHKDEIVFESEITKTNKNELLGLRTLLQKGFKLSQLIAPNISLPSPMQFAPATVEYASGGYVSGPGFSFYEQFQSLKKELSLLRTELKEKNMVVNNYISANDIIKKTSPALVNEINNKGEKIRGRF